MSETSDREWGFSTHTSGGLTPEERLDILMGTYQHVDLKMSRLVAAARGVLTWVFPRREEPLVKGQMFSLLGAEAAKRHNEALKHLREALDDVPLRDIEDGA